MLIFELRVAFVTGYTGVGANVKLTFLPDRSVIAGPNQKTPTDCLPEPNSWGLGQ